MTALLEVTTLLDSLIGLLEYLDLYSYNWSPRLPQW